ncbi:cytochrome B [Pseudomonas sp. C2L11]|nr:cytochrome b/b6 domain-containing protein [Pseudomonas typographi]MBD1553883.1 cytochrome B [Pseudomonas typographi]
MCTRYSRSRRALHWLSAVIILWASVSGFGVQAFPPGCAIRQWVESFNPQITSVFIPLFAWRLWLKCTQPGSANLNVAGAVHWALYGLVSAVLVTGVLMMATPVTMFGLFTLPSLVHDAVWLARLHHWHQLACMALAALVGLHLAAVVWHQMRGHTVMARMR